MKNTAIFVSLLCCGCASLIQTPSQRDAARSKAMQQEMERQRQAQNLEFARAAAQSAESRVEQLEQRLSRIESNYAQNAAAQNQQMTSELESLRRGIAELRADRESLKREIVEEISGKMTTIVNDRTKTLEKNFNASLAAQRKAVASAAQTGYEHKVETGQTLSDIAKAYKTSVAKIKAANELKSDTIRVGQVLFIPDK